MVGLIQAGIFSSVAAAAPLPMPNNNFERIVFLDHHDRHWEEKRRREHDKRMRLEHERHEREMRRRHHESEREWRERQRLEEERHDRELRDIAAIIIGIVIGRS